MNRTRIYKAVALVTAFLITVSAFPAGVLAEEQVPEGPPGRWFAVTRAARPTIWETADVRPSCIRIRSATVIRTDSSGNMIRP